jgi:hypothetical protein
MVRMLWEVTMWRSIPRTTRSVVVPAVIWLLAVTAQAAAQVPCLGFDGVLAPGGSIELTVDDSSWVELLLRYDHVYRFTVSAVPGTTVELWSLDFNEGEQCYVRDDLLTTVEMASSTTAIDWTDQSPLAEALRVALPAGSAVTDVVAELDEVAAPPEDGVLVVPAVAHTVGARGELFQSDLVVFNPLGVEVPAALVFTPTGSAAKQRVDIEVGPHEMVAFEDVVTTVFGLDDGVGALRIEFPSFRTLKAVSRTYAVSGLGTYGQFVPALRFSDAASLGAGGAERVLPHLAKSADFRSNVGFVEVLGLEAVLDLEMVDENGTVIARSTIHLPPLSHRQINDVFDFFQVEGRSNAAVRVELGSHGRVFVYASVVDNQSSDPILVPGLIANPQFPWSGDQSDVLLVPAAASTRGLFGTRWRTDVRVLPATGEVGHLEVTFVPNDGSDSADGVFEFAGTGPLAVDDVVARLGASGAGHLWLHSSAGEILATSRTYTDDGGGSYGQFIPAGWWLVDLDRGVVLGLRGDDEYRSNIGLVNPFSNPVEVELRLVTAAGELLGTRLEALAPDQGRQLNDVFAAFGVDGCDLCRLEFEVESVAGRDDVYVWGSVVDNRSGDAVFIPPIPY